MGRRSAAAPSVGARARQEFAAYPGWSEAVRHVTAPACTSDACSVPPTNTSVAFPACSGVTTATSCVRQGPDRRVDGELHGCGGAVRGGRDGERHAVLLVAPGGHVGVGHRRVLVLGRRHAVAVGLVAGRTGHVADVRGLFVVVLDQDQRDALRQGDRALLDGGSAGRRPPRRRTRP